jgi:acetolactate synthase-1/2/3 large subunit
MLAELEDATRVPAVVLESPRGVADATIGAFSEVMRRADLVVLLGKALDFTVRWLEPPVADKSARVIVLDPDGALVARAAREKGERLLIGAVADSMLAAQALIARAKLREPRTQVGSPRRCGHRWAAAYLGRSCVDHAGQAASDRSVSRARPCGRPDPATILICDGGEFAQWGQCLLKAPRRMINSVTGAIGAGLPFALAARVHDAEAPVFAVMGDGTFGFHMAEIETAVRRKLPFVAIVGNDACWNAESQLQRRHYGENRMHGCELLPSRYDLLASALGGTASWWSSRSAGRRHRQGIASGKPAVVNVMTESIAAPVLGRGA